MQTMIHETRLAVIEATVVAGAYVKCVETDRRCTRVREWFVFADRVVAGESYKCSYKPLPASVVTKARALI